MSAAGWTYLGAVLGVYGATALAIALGYRAQTLKRLTRLVLASFWTVSAAVLAWRFARGLGAITAMTDGFPWGVWIGLLQSGVALAAGGFVTAAAVHVFHIRRFEPILRPMVLTAFLGYSFVAMTLCIEVGRPQSLWHPLVMWQHHSIMFEVAWCVTLYMTVLLVEFSPVVFEHLRMEKAVRALHAAAVPIVIAGVVLSVLHQSSMGSMFLVMPQKMHAAWFSPLLPVFFLVSAVAVGLCVTILESFFSYRIYGRGLEGGLLLSLARAARAVLVIYLAMKLVDLSAREAWSSLAAEPWLGWLFAVEIGLGVAAPILLFSLRAVRAHPLGLVVPSAMAAGGVVLNRLDVSWFSFVPYTRTSYFPTWMEITVSFFLVTVTVAVFGWCVHRLPVFPEGPVSRRARR